MKKIKLYIYVVHTTCFFVKSPGYKNRMRVHSQKNYVGDGIIFLHIPICMNNFPFNVITRILRERQQISYAVLRVLEDLDCYQVAVVGVLHISKRHP
jgi:hypothetical protein